MRIIIANHGVIRPIELLSRLVNHRAPSGPAAIPWVVHAGACVVGHDSRRW